MEKSFEMWSPYHKIPYKLSQNPPQGLLYVVTEKVHGANFSVITNGVEVKFSKRSRILDLEEPFFQFQRLSRELTKDALELFSLSPRKGDLLVVYGELCGGQYPHSSVPVVAGLKPVQSGIYYAPDLKFVVFDIAMLNSEAVPSWFSFDEMRSYGKRCNFDVVEPLHIGTKKTAFSFSPRFQSSISRQFGLPQIPSNLAEGVVVKPIDGTRFIVKLKNEEFGEICDENEFERETTVRDVGRMILRVNGNRIAAARSKLGCAATIDEIAEMVCDDVVVELCEDRESAVWVASVSSEQLGVVKSYALEQVRLFFEPEQPEDGRKSAGARGGGGGAI